MALTKQEIMLQIAQGKIHTALEHLIQVTGQANDKELQQRSILLFSQLTQLKTSFGNGTIDNRTFQLEQNRITEAALLLANELPSTQQSYQRGRSQYVAQNAPSNSGWKTWGILLTGAGGLLVILMIVQLMMNQNTQNTNLPQQNFQQANPGTVTQPTQKETPTISQPVEQVKASSPQDQFVGSWEGVMYIAGVTIGGLTIHLNSDLSYNSRVVNPMDGTIVSQDQGAWFLTENGRLVLRSSLGAKEVYNVQWNNNNRFNALLVDGTNPELLGLSVVFSKMN